MTRGCKNSLSLAAAPSAFCFTTIAMALLCPALLAQPQQVFFNTPDIVFPTGNTIQINALNNSDTTISGLSGGTVDPTGAVSALVSAPSVGPQGITTINLPVTPGRHVIPFLMALKRSQAEALSASYLLQAGTAQPNTGQIIPSSSASWFQGTYNTQGTPRIEFRKPLPHGFWYGATHTFRSGPVPIAGGGYVLSAHNEGQSDAHVTFSCWDASGANILNDSTIIPAGQSAQSPATALPGVYSFRIASDKTTISPNLLVTQSSTSSQQFWAAQWNSGGNDDWSSGSERRDLWNSGPQ